MVMPDALGITHISDLSPGDMDKVRSVALVELTITFEDHNIPLRPRRPAKLKSIPGQQQIHFGLYSCNYYQYSFCSNHLMVKWRQSHWEGKIYKHQLDMVKWVYYTCT